MQGSLAARPRRAGAACQAGGAHRITPPEEPSRAMASASAVATRSSASCRPMPSLRWHGTVRQGRDTCGSGCWQAGRARHPAGGPSLAPALNAEAQHSSPSRTKTHTTLGGGAGGSAGCSGAAWLRGRQSRGLKERCRPAGPPPGGPHLNSESRRPHRKVEPEPSVVQGSRVMVPPMGQPYTCAGTEGGRAGWRHVKSGRGRWAAMCVEHAAGQRPLGRGVSSHTVSSKPGRQRHQATCS